MINPYKTLKFKPALQKCSSLVMAYDHIPASARAAAQAVFSVARESSSDSRPMS